MEQPDLLKFLVQALERLELPYAIVGSFASSIWGESRLTQDIDVVIRLEPSQVSALCSAFPQAEFYVSEAAAADAVTRQGQFNVIHPASGNKIDFMIDGRHSWQRDQLQRSKQVPLFPDQTAAVAAPDDVIVGKLAYYKDGGSDKHLRDIAGILKFSSSMVDREYVGAHAAQLGLADVWRAIQDRVPPT